MEEREGYVLLTRAHKRGNFNYEEPGQAEVVQKAVQTHKSRNRHHIEYHTTPDVSLDEVDALEMVCDWAAIAQERSGDSYMSPRPYFETVVKETLSQTVIRRVEDALLLLEKALAAARC